MNITITSIKHKCRYLNSMFLSRNQFLLPKCNKEFNNLANNIKLLLYGLDKDLNPIIGNSLGEPMYTSKLLAASKIVPNSVFPDAFNILLYLENKT